MRRFTIYDLRFTILVAAGLAIWSSQPALAQGSAKLAPPVEVQMIHPVRGEITRSITLPGRIQAYQQATLYAKVGGYLKSIRVDKGDRIKEGELIAEIEVPELLADQKKQLVEIEVANRDYQRLVEAQKKAPDLVTPHELDDAKGKWEIARAYLERTETFLKFAQVIAPFAGVVTERFVDRGAFIPAATSGSAARSAAVVAIMDFSKVRVQVAVPENEASFISTNSAAAVAVEGLPGRSFENRVTRHPYALDENTRTLQAEIEIPNPNDDLRPGMYATVKLVMERKPNALLLPVSAILVEKAGSSVFLVAGDKAKKVPVKTGFNDGKNVEITSGVEANQAVIVVGKLTLTDGQPVKIIETK